MRRHRFLIPVFLGFALAAFAAATSLLWSPIGRSVISSLAEREIARAVGGDVKIASLEGDLLTTLEFNGVKFSADGADWAVIDQIVINWSARAIFGRRVEVKDVLIKDARLLARPPKRPSSKPFKGFELPDHLPSIEIGRIAIDNLQIDRALVGEPLRLDGDGAIRLGGKSLFVAAQLKGSDDRDLIAVKIERPKNGGPLSLKIEVSSKSNGAIASLSRADGPVSIAIEGAGPITQYEIVVEGDAGAYGAARAKLSGDIKEISTLNFWLAATPGSRFEGLQPDLGEQVRIEGVFEPAENGGILKVASLDLGLGSVSGSIDWSNRRDALDKARLNLSAALRRGWRASIQHAIGDKVEAELTVKSKGKGYTVTGAATAPFVVLKSDGVETDLRSEGAGPIEVRIIADSSLALAAKSSISMSAISKFSAFDNFELSAIKASTATGASFVGTSDYSRSEGILVVKGDYEIAASAVRDFAPSVTPMGAIAGKIELAGGIDDLSLDLTASLPAMKANRVQTQPARAKATLAGIPSGVSGEVSFQSVDGATRGAATVARAPDGFWSISKLDYRGESFALKGAVSFNPATREGAADLIYSGDDGAEPWPGLTLAGGATVKGALLKANASNRLELNAPRLASTRWSAENLNARVEGPYRRAKFSIGASSFRAIDWLDLDKLRVDGVADFSAGPTFAINAASAAYGGAPVLLTKSAAISFGEGVAVDSLSLGLGADGRFDLDGGFSKKRWLATVKIADLDLANAGSTLDFTLALDTDAETPASGAFAISSSLSKKDNRSLPGEFTWDGEHVLINAGGDGGNLAIGVALPLELSRSNGVALTMEGDLSGEVSYAGRAEAIAIFLPVALQSFEGDLSFSGEVMGTLAHPEVSGSVNLSKGAFTELISGLSIVDIDLSASAKATAAGSNLQFTATAAGAGQSQKSIKATGAISFSENMSIDTTLTLDRARLSAGPVQSVDASGVIAVSGPADKILIEGDVSINGLVAELFTPRRSSLVDIEVVAVGANGETLRMNNTPARRGALRYAIRIEADDNVQIQGRGLNSEWRANAQIVGTSASPLVLGALNLRRGDLEFSGRRFDIVRGSVGFDTLSPNDPTIDLRAERETRDGTTVAVVISGRSSALKVALESSPSLPSEDAMALILFDKPANELSAVQSLQVADALTQLGGVGVFGGKGVAGAARDALGLDLLNIDVDQTDSSASLLTVGKYVADGLFVSASQNARGENGSLRIEYEIGQSFSVETELRQDGDQTVSTNWKKDF